MPSKHHKSSSKNRKKSRSKKLRAHSKKSRTRSKRSRSLSRKLLPQPDPNMSLSKFGYELDRSVKERRAALNRAINKRGYLPVLRRLNLIRNISPTGTNNKEKLADDVHFLSRQYKLAH